MENFERKIKSSFIIYADFESILVPEDNWKQNPEESSTNKYREHIACSYGYKLTCVDDKFCNSFKTYLIEDAAYNFINSMIKESKYCSEVMKKHFNKKLVITKEDNENFENSTKCWVCDSYYVDNDFKVRDHFQIIGKHRGSACKDCNINLKLNCRIHIVFNKLKIYDSHLIMEGLGKFNLKISVIPNGLEKYMIYTINSYI